VVDGHWFRGLVVDGHGFRGVVVDRSSWVRNFFSGSWDDSVRRVGVRQVFGLFVAQDCLVLLVSGILHVGHWGVDNWLAVDDVRQDGVGVLIVSDNGVLGVGDDGVLDRVHLRNFVRRLVVRGHGFMLDDGNGHASVRSLVEQRLVVFNGCVVVRSFEVRHIRGIKVVRVLVDHFVVLLVNRLKMDRANHVLHNHRRDLVRCGNCVHCLMVNRSRLRGFMVHRRGFGCFLVDGCRLRCLVVDGDWLWLVVMLLSLVQSFRDELLVEFLRDFNILHTVTLWVHWSSDCLHRCGSRDVPDFRLCVERSLNVPDLGLVVELGINVSGLGDDVAHWGLTLREVGLLVIVGVGSGSADVVDVVHRIGFFG